MLLAPGKDPEEVVNFFGYTLGIALDKYQQALHASCAMGNHHHTDATDTAGTLPAFKDSLHANLARGMNAKRGRFDKFWSSDGSCDTRQPTDDEALDDLVYTLTNPVDAGLVKWGHRWPGFTTYGWRFGEVRTFKRPDWYYDPNNPDIPDEVQITLERPNIFPELSDDELYDLLMKKVREREVEIQTRMRRENRRFVGEKKLRRQHWNQAPKTREDRFTITPKVAASSKWLRLAQLQRDRKWEADYAAARAGYLAGKDHEFPTGTYWMRLYANVRVANAPP